VFLFPKEYLRDNNIFFNDDHCDNNNNNYCSEFFEESIIRQYFRTLNLILGFDLITCTVSEKQILPTKEVKQNERNRMNTGTKRNETSSSGMLITKPK
jgi:hypothetical protein